MSCNKAYSLQFIADAIGADLQLQSGQENCQIKGIASLQAASAGDLTFLANEKYRAMLANTQATAVIVAASQADLCPSHALVVDDPYVGFAKAAQLFDNTPTVAAGIHASAVVAPSAQVAATAAIGAHAVIGENVVLADGVTVGPGSVLAANCRIGSDTCIKSGVHIYHNVNIGSQCLIHSGAVIGSDGFGLANDDGSWIKIPQLGGVSIGDNVEIGANTTIDRGALEDTVIGNGVKIDNQVQVAHNVTIGDHSACAAQVGIAGSTQVGKHCIFAGKVGVSGHVKITDNVTVLAMSGISHNISDAGVYSASIPAEQVNGWRRTWGQVRRLKHLSARVKKLERLIGKGE